MNPQRPLRLLLIDDNPDDRLLTMRELTREFRQVEIDEVRNADELARAITAGRFDLVITDYQLRWTTGLDVLREVKAKYPERPVIMFTATGTQEIAVEAMKSGLDDYVLKSVKHYIRLAASVRTALDRAAMRRRAADLDLRLQTLLNRLNVGVFRSTVFGDLIECNPAFLRLLGAPTLQEAKDSPLLRAILWPTGEPRPLDLVRQVGDRSTRDVRAARPDGSPLWLSVSEVVNKPNGDIVVDGLVEDVTDRTAAAQKIRELNETLEQRVRARTAELERANEELDAFASAVSHDLQEPLRAIQGYLQALVQDEGGRLSPHTAAAVERIDKAAERMDLLIRDLLHYSRLGNAPMPPHRVQMDLVIRDALAGLSGAIAATGAEVRIGEPLLDLQGHHETVLRSLMNLMSNAMKFVAPGQTPRVHVWTERRPGRVRLWVEDNGIGIPAESLHRIFNVFERLHGMETYPGTGVGLAAVRKGITRLGGDVGVESQLSAGSRFWFELPAPDNAHRA